MRRSVAAIGIVVSAAMPAFAIDMPARKPGLWELSMVFEGRNLPPQSSQHCIDAETDRMMNAMGNSTSQQSCSKQDIQRAGNSIVVDSICNFGGMTMITHGVVTGDFNSAYTVKTESRREGGPAVPGMPVGQTTHMTISAKWLGACKPGQQPGDMIMSNGMTMNIRNLPGMGAGVPKR